MNKLLLFFLLSGAAVGKAQQLPLSNSIKTLFFGGLKAKLADNLDSAADKFRAITALDSINHAAHYELAGIAMRQNRLPQACAHIQRAVGLAPANVWYLRMQVDVCKQSANLACVLQTLDKIITLLPNDQQAYLDKANALLMGGKEEEARVLLAMVANQFGQSRALAAAQRHFTAKTGAGVNISSWLSQSDQLFQAQKFAEALDLLNKAKQAAPDNFEVDLAMADVLSASNRHQEAMVMLKQALDHRDMPLPAKMQLVGAMLGKSNMLDKATELADALAANYPSDAKTQMLFGDALYKQGKLGQARIQFELAVKLADDFYAGYEKLLGAQTQLADYPAAVKTADMALSLFPNQAILYYYRAFALHRLNRNAEAGLEIINALDLNSDDKILLSMVYALQAEVFIDQQKQQQANASFEKALAIDPENYLIVGNYAYYLAVKEQQLPQALQLAEKAVKGMPKDASLQDTYALVLMKLSRFAEAKQWQEKAIQNNPSPPAVYLEHYGDILFLSGEKDRGIAYWIKSQKAGNTTEKLTNKINEQKYFK